MKIHCPPALVTLEFAARTKGRSGGPQALTVGEQRPDWGGSPLSSPRAHGRLLVLALAALVLTLWAAPPALAAGGQISGTVRDAAQAPLAGIAVTLYDSGQNLVGNATTDAGGTYAFPGLAASTYYVGFMDPTGAHATRFANDEPSLESADPITVTDPGTTTVDATLPAEGTIAGVVNDPNGHGVGGITVTAYLSNGRDSGSSTTTNDDGTYSLTVEAGTYEIGFSDGRDTSTPLVPQFYDDKPTIEAATPILVTAGHTAQLNPTTLQAGGSITGLVTDASSAPLSGIEVDLYGQNGDFQNSTTTDASGNYTFDQLTPGTYKVGFASGSSQINVAPQFYDMATNLHDATGVVVNPGAPTTVNQALATGGSIMGTVTDPATGAALGGINVLAYDSTGDFVTGTTTDANGKYMLVGLPGGSYGVGFSDPNGERLTRYFHDARSLEAATPVLVTAGQPSTADQALPLAGISRDRHVG